MAVCGTGISSISSTNGISGVILPPTQVIIEKLAEQIEFSHLAQSLRDRINLITDLQNGITQVNSLVVDETNILAQELLALKNDLTGAVAYINEQTQVSIGQRESMVNSINTLMAQYGTSIAALEEQSTVLAEASGALMAEKTVKTDLAGNVSGYGLSTYVDPQGNATSDFQVRADTFSIAPPAVYSATPPAGGFNGKVWIDTSAGNTPKWYNSTTETWQTTPVKGAVPFIVKTTSETIDGKVIPAGVYIDSAYISKLTADKIDTRGLSIKDANGNVILSAGTTLDWSKVGGANKPADGATKNQIIRQANPPTGGTYSVGDLWIDTDATPTTVANWDGSQWVIIGNYTSNTNQLTDGAGLGTKALWTGVTGSGKPADGATKNQIFRQSTQPTGSSTGDLWVNTGANPVTVSQWTGSSWSSIGNYTTNTNQLVDGASLGSTAIWSYVSGSNKPADNATVGATFGVNISGKMSDASVYINSLAVGRLLVQTFTATSTGSAAMTNGATSDITVNHYTGRAVLPFVAWNSPPSEIHSIVFTYADSNSFRFRMYAQSGSTGYSGTVSYAYGYF